MAKFGKYKVGFKKDVSFMSVLMSTVKFVLYMYAGGLILNVVAPLINVTASPFANAFELIGIDASTNGMGTVNSDSLLGVGAIIASVYLILKFVNVRSA